VSRILGEFLQSARAAGREPADDATAYRSTPDCFVRSLHSGNQTGKIGGLGTPMAAAMASASVHEVKLIEPLLKRVRVPKMGRGRPRKRLGQLIYDKAADSGPLRKRLKASGTDSRKPSLKVIFRQWGGSRKKLLKSIHSSASDRSPILCGVHLS